MSRVCVPAAEAHPSDPQVPLKLLPQDHLPRTTGFGGMEPVDVPGNDVYTHDEEWWATNNCLLIVEVNVVSGSLKMEMLL